MNTVKICHLYISPGHNFFGHHGRPPDNWLATEVDTIDCVAGRGIRDDRFFDYRNDYKGQITFFSLEVFDELCAQLGISATSPAAVRRNVIVRGVDLNRLFNADFEVQGVQFRGAGECKPCYWMDQAIGPGAENFLIGRGGLRARIVTNGQLRSLVKNTAPNVA